MSDENGAALFNPGSGVTPKGKEDNIDPTPSQTEGQDEESQQPKYITEDILNERLEDFQRRVQSSRDSALSTFDKRIKSKIENVERDIEAWRKTGVNITPEQEQQRRLNALQEAILENPDAPSPSSQPANARQQGNQEELVKRINAQAYQISQQAGVQLAENDPELTLLDQSSPEAYLQSFRNALYQKQLRTGQNAKPPEARVPSMGTATKPPADLAEQFLKEYKAAQGKGLQTARDIRERYRQRGLNVGEIISENF